MGVIEKSGGIAGFDRESISSIRFEDKVVNDRARKRYVYKLSGEPMKDDLRKRCVWVISRLSRWLGIVQSKFYSCT